MLPDRFDAQGRPLDGSGTGAAPRLHSRRGDFEYRSPRGPGAFNMRGEWGVAGTDSEAVERIVRNVTGILEGRGSWLGLLGTILGGGLLEGGGASDETEGQERRSTKRREAEGRRRRSTGWHDRYDVDEDYFYDDERKRRRMVRAGRRRE